jgi:hypothetical protein
MATTSTPPRTSEELRRELEAERERLAAAVEALRSDLGEAANVAAKLRERLPLVAGGALGLGFVAAGGIGATVRLIFRRGREGQTKARVGRFSLLDRG